MSLIEQAAKRLEELRRAAAEPDGGEEAASARRVEDAEPLPTPAAAAVRGLPGRTGLMASQAPDAAESPRRMPDPSFSRLSQPKLEVDLGVLRNRSFVTPDMPRALLADEFRIVKRPIMRNAFGPDKVRNGNLVMVTSALAGEGKTFTAVNLALSTAMEFDTSVILVDGDVAHPDLPNILGVRKEPGLLAILPAGAPQPRATELLASAQMQKILGDLSSRYADLIIIFDSPPLLPTTEARELASHMGQIVMVVAADKTHQHAVELALETVEKCEVVLMLLNMADKTEVGSYYGYYGYDRPRR
jgi:receptor protein-tyrosine kinase